MQNTPILQSLENQLSQRLEKLWRVFSWCSSILISITAGMIVFPKTNSITFTPGQLILISAVIIILTLYAKLWINENLKFEVIIRDQLDKFFAEELNYPGYKELRPDKAKFGYKDVVILLGAVALVATWIDFVLDKINL